MSIKNKSNFLGNDLINSVFQDHGAQAKKITDVSSIFLIQYLSNLFSISDIIILDTFLIQSLSVEKLYFVLIFNYLL
jgi:hypothetical protein